MTRLRVAPDAARATQPELVAASIIGSPGDVYPRRKPRMRDPLDVGLGGPDTGTAPLRAPVRSRTITGWRIA